MCNRTHGPLWQGGRERKRERKRAPDTGAAIWRALCRHSVSAAERKRERPSTQFHSHTVPYHHLATIPLLDILFPAFPIAAVLRASLVNKKLLSTYTVDIFSVWPHIWTLAVAWASNGLEGKRCLDLKAFVLSEHILTYLFALALFLLLSMRRQCAECCPCFPGDRK